MSFLGMAFPAGEESNKICGSWRDLFSLKIVQNDWEIDVVAIFKGMLIWDKTNPSENKINQEKVQDQNSFGMATPHCILILLTLEA